MRYYEIHFNNVFQGEYHASSWLNAIKQWEKEYTTTVNHAFMEYGHYPECKAIS